MTKENVSKKYKWNGAEVYKNQEEKFLVEIRHLLPMNAGWVFLDENSRATIENDSFLRFLGEVNKGKVITNHYNDYKGYMFIICKNEFLKHMNLRFTIKRKDRNLYIDELSDSLQLGRENTFESNLEINDLLKKLPPHQQEIVKLLTQGYNIKEISQIIHIPNDKGPYSSIGYVTRNIKELRKILFKNYKPSFKMKFGTLSELNRVKKSAGRINLTYKKETDDDYNDFYDDYK